ncbi:MAG: thermonuclease family protein [Ignavibacteriales bacterium]|nr:thermonuclease family protein [Ignavibacteriales bacterium]
MNWKTFLILNLLTVCLTYGQTVKVVEILDANLFRLEDGRKIKLAGIDVPQQSISYNALKEIANEAIELSSVQLKNHRFKLQVLSENKDYQLVFLIKEYPLETLNMSVRFLERGMGKYFPNHLGIDSVKLVDAENYANKREENLWSYYHKNSTDTLDYSLTHNGIACINDSVSLRTAKIFQPLPIGYSIPLQFLAGTGLAIVFAIPSCAVGYAIETTLLGSRGEMRGLGGVILGMYAGYFWGFTTGVYITAKRNYPDINYGELLGITFGLTTLTSAVTALIVNDKHNSIPYLVALSSPAVFSLILANTYYNTPQIEQPPNTSINHSFQDFRDSRTTRLELFRINF